MTANAPSHYDDHGRARMVDIGGKSVTHRTARAEGAISITGAIAEAIRSGTVPKGNPFETARLAGIQAAKKTHELIPLCHPLRLSRIDVEIQVEPGEGMIRAEVIVEADERTGVEMEALTACAIALLTVYDMLKAIDKGMVIGPVRLLEKSGGKSDFTAPPAP